MKRKIMGAWIVIFLFVLFSPDLACRASAGGINAAEQKVINAVSGSFSYQGKTYSVKSQYIAEGRSKLAEDGIDLSDDEAASYIAQFRNSYAELVEGGYCEEADSQNQDSNSGKEEEKGQKTDADKKTPSETQDSSDGEEAGQGEAKDGRVGTSGQSQVEKRKNELFLRAVLGERKEPGTGGSPQDSSEKETDIEWLEEEDLGTALEFDASDRNAAKEQTVTISESVRHHQRNVRSQQEAQEVNILDQFLHLKQWKILSYVILGFSAAMAALIGCYLWMLRKHHHKKRKLRLGIAVGTGISMAGLAFMLMLVMGFYFGVYNKEAIHRHLMESDYYSGITQMLRDLAGERLREAGCEEKMVSGIFSLSHVYINEKQYIDAVLSGSKKNEISTDMVEEALMEQIPDSLGEKKPVLVQEIKDLYQDTLQFALGRVIWESRRGFLPWCYAMTGIGCFLLVVLFILVYQMYGYLHKSARVCAVAILSSSIFITGAALTMRLRHLAGKFQAKPIYYQQFIQKYVAWSVNVLFYVGCIGLLAAVSLFVWKRYLHMIYVE